MKNNNINKLEVFVYIEKDEIDPEKPCSKGYGFTFISLEEAFRFIKTCEKSSEEYLKFTMTCR